MSGQIEHVQQMSNEDLYREHIENMQSQLMDVNLHKIMREEILRRMENKNEGN
jgi:hypothetical protein